MTEILPFLAKNSGVEIIKESKNDKRQTSVCGLRLRLVNSIISNSSIQTGKL
jgi:hypothetical protein